jgi:cytochrome c biogenesis protein CcdA
MVGTIVHAVSVDRSNGKSSLVLWIHVLSYLAGASLTGAVLGLVGFGIHWVVPQFSRGSTQLFIVGIACVCYSLRELDLFRMPAPKFFRQVPSKYRLTMSPRRLALVYGFELGAGITTYASTTTFYVVVLWILLVGSPQFGVLVMAAYGIGRGLPMLWLGNRKRAGDGGELMGYLQSFKPAVHYLNGLVLTFTGAFLLVVGRL